MYYNKFITSIFLIIFLVEFSKGHEHEYGEKTAIDVLNDIYEDCLDKLTISCAKPKALKWLTAISNNDIIHVTDDMVIRKFRETPIYKNEERSFGAYKILDKIEDFLSTHQLEVKAPEILRSDEQLRSLVPRSIEAEDVKVPLAETGRSSLIRKVILPFFLGLKFKTAVVVPLALALIALKSWKALTLGLLSLVLSGAMVIYKFTKPKIVNYEVIHYPHHVDHHVDHIVEHPAPVTGWEHPGYGRSMDYAQELAYNAYNN